MMEISTKEDVLLAFANNGEWPSCIKNTSCFG